MILMRSSAKISRSCTVQCLALCDSLIASLSLSLTVALCVCMCVFVCVCLFGVWFCALQEKAGSQGLEVRLNRALEERDNLKLQLQVRVLLLREQR